jgi:hypothetical protein
VECQGQFQGRFVTSVEGLTMPVFTFEKISPPMRRASASPAAEKPRSAIVQILDRFVEKRVKRKVSGEKAGKQPRQRKSSK